MSSPLQHIIWLIMEHLSNLLDPLLFAVLMHQQVQPKQRQTRKSLLLVFASAIWLELAQSYWQQSYALSLFGYGLLLFTYAYIFDGATGFQRFFLPCIGSLIPFIVNLLLISFATMWPELLPNSFEPGATRIIMVTSYMILSFISYVFIMRRRYQCDSLPLRKKYEGSAVVMAMILFCALIFDNIMHLALSPELARIMILFCFGSVCFILYFLASFYRTLQQNDAHDKLHEEILQVQEEAQNLQHALSLQELLHDLQHDLGNHFVSLRGYAKKGDYEEMLRYLGQLEAEFAPAQELPFADHVGLNAVIAAKTWNARQQGIAVERRFATPRVLPLPETALCAVMGNLLDNAIEACIRIEDPSQRFLSLKAHAKDDFWFVEIRNTHDGNIVLGQDGYCSTKGVNRRGRGLARATKFVHQANGSIIITHDERSFTASLCLPLV